MPGYLAERLPANISIEFGRNKALKRDSEEGTTRTYKGTHYYVGSRQQNEDGSVTFHLTRQKKHGGTEHLDVTI